MKSPSPTATASARGMWIALIPPFIDREPWIAYPLAFLLFRLFDITKPLGARKLEALPRGWGVLLDDVLSGIYAALVLWGVGYLWQ